MEQNLVSKLLKFHLTEATYT